MRRPRSRPYLGGTNAPCVLASERASRTARRTTFRQTLLAPKGAPAPPPNVRPMSSTRRWRVVLVAAVALVAFLYYRPLRAYFDTRHSLAGRRADVRGLQAEKRLLEHELAISTSPAALELEARQLGLVKPGERLFIVKGIAAWERKHAATIRRGG
ncbi:MAG: hypothetical protein E6G07_01135 [Actinobacteria bacterium]|nr:MAG: hypothetical protein E6G07_01135 [Actinomycetota bacterium]